MTVFFEASGPFQAKPGHFRTPVMVRYWWLWFAVGWLRVSLHEFSVTAYDWRGADGG